MATYVAINREDLDTVSLIEADSEKDADQILMEHLGWDGDVDSMYEQYSVHMAEGIKIN